MFRAWLKRCIRRWLVERENARALKAIEAHYDKAMAEHPDISHEDALKLAVEGWGRELSRNK